MDNPYCQSSLSINILFFFPCSRTKNSALICQMPIVKSPLESFGFFSSFPMLPSWTFLPVKDCEVLLLSDSQGSCSGSSSILEPKNLGALWRTGPCSLLNQLNCSMDEARSHTTVAKWRIAYSKLSSSCHSVHSETCFYRTNCSLVQWLTSRFTREKQQFFRVLAESQLVSF